MQTTELKQHLNPPRVTVIAPNSKQNIRKEKFSNFFAIVFLKQVGHNISVASYKSINDS